MPVGFAKMTEGPHIRVYKTMPLRHANNRKITLAQAHVIGDSSVNAEVFTRGCSDDYDRWANDEVCAGWSFDEVKPYVLTSEDNDSLAGESHSHGSACVALIVSECTTAQSCRASSAPTPTRRPS